MIGERIKELRLALDLKQPTFGKRLGVTAAAISRIENGERQLTDQMAKAICSTYNVSYIWLKDGMGDMFNAPNVSTLTAIDNLLMSDNEAAKLLLKVIEKMDRRQWDVVAEILLMLKEE